MGECHFTQFCYSMRWQWFFGNRDLSLRYLPLVLSDQPWLHYCPCSYATAFRLNGTKITVLIVAPFIPDSNTTIFFSGRQYWYHLFKTKAARKWCFWGEGFVVTMESPLANQIVSLTKNTNGSGYLYGQIFQRQFPLCLTKSRYCLMYHLSWYKDKQ